MVDSHCHLTDERLDAAEIIGTMDDDGLKSLVTVGYDMLSSRECVRLAAAHDSVYATVGLQPSELKGATEAGLAELAHLAENPKVVAVGEMGLDYHYDDVDRETQRYWLCRQLELTAASGLPAVFHLRDAYEDMEKIIFSSLDKLPARGVLHCFSGSKETALKFIDRGFYISFSGVVTFKNAVKYAEIIRAVPADRIMAETDSPYLTPEPFRGKVNRPALVRRVIETIAACRGIDFGEAGQMTEQNTRRLFFRMR